MKKSPSSGLLIDGALLVTGTVGLVQAFISHNLNSKPPADVDNKNTGDFNWWLLCLFLGMCS